MAYSCYDANKDPRTGMYKPTQYTSNIQPPQLKGYEPKEYKDPVSAPFRQYEFKPYKPRVYKPTYYAPVMTVKQYELPDVDPLTGKPRRKKNQAPPKEPEKQERQKPVVETHPTPSSSAPVSSFPAELGNPAGSVRRTLKFHEPTEPLYDDEF